MKIMRIANPILLGALLLGTALQSGAQEAAPAPAAVQFSGAGWFQFGRVEHSTDATANNINSYNKNWMQTSGVNVGALLKIDENWEGALGLGIVQVPLI